MALTDPELELLLEVVAEDPGDDVYLQIGEELIRRARWAEAATHLMRGIAHAPDAKGWEMLGRAHLEAGDPLAALRAIENAPRAPGSEASRVEILALERGGRVADAREKATALLAADSGDIVAQALIERLDSPPQSGRVRSPDPDLTVDRAEQYVTLDRVDRAIRLYRRLLFHNPGHIALGARLRELARETLVADDFSRDFTTDTAPIPADLAPLVVVPRVGPTSVAPAAESPAAPPVQGAHDSDDEDTDTMAMGPLGPRRKRRRSLLNP